MPMIANYYAQVGINIDTAGAVKVQRYLDGIKRQLTSFQRAVSRTTDIPLKVRVDTKRSMSGINRELRAISGMANLTIRNLNFSRTEAVRNLNKVLSGSHGKTNLRIGALLSQESLRGMREQLRASINSLTVSPTIRPNVRQAVQRGASQGRVGGGRRADGGTMLDPRNTRRMSPWHNPMMIGGGIGAFLRYGAFSLPFVAGTFGLNALSRSSERVQNTYLGVRAQVGEEALAQDQLSFLTTLGYNHGIRVTDMAPGYAQMFAAAQGSSLQDFMQQGFQNFIQYASVAGLNEEQKRGSILALSQIVGKGGRGFAQELNLQLTNQGMPNARRLFADAVAGGDMAKFEQMMQRGEVGLEGVRKFLELLGRRAQPFLEDYYGTITAQKGRVGFASEQYLKTFLDAGGTRGLADFFGTFAQVVRESTPFAEKIGAAFERAAYAASAMLLVPGELNAWVKGTSEEDNIFHHFFGSVEQHQEFVQMREEIDTLINNIKNINLDGLFIMDSLFTNIKRSVQVINFVLQSMNKFSELFKTLKETFEEEGVSGIVKGGLKYQETQRVKEALEKQGITQDDPRFPEAFKSGMESRREAREKDWVPDWLRWIDNSLLDFYSGAWDLSKSTGSWMYGAVENRVNSVMDFLSTVENSPFQLFPRNSNSVPTEVNVNVTVSGDIGVEPNEVFTSTFGDSIKNQTYQTFEEIISGVAKNNVPSTPH